MSAPKRSTRERRTPEPTRTKAAAKMAMFSRKTAPRTLAPCLMKMSLSSALEETSERSMTATNPLKTGRTD